MCSSLAYITTALLSLKSATGSSLICSSFILFFDFSESRRLARDFSPVSVKSVSAGSSSIFYILAIGVNYSD